MKEEIEYLDKKSLKLANAVFILVMWLSALVFRYTTLYKNPVIEFYCNIMLKNSVLILVIVIVLFCFYCLERREKKSKWLKLK